MYRRQICIGFRIETEKNSATQLKLIASVNSGLLVQRHKLDNFLCTSWNRNASSRSRAFVLEKFSKILKSSSLDIFHRATNFPRKNCILPISFFHNSLQFFLSSIILRSSHVRFHFIDRSISIDFSPVPSSKDGDKKMVT